MYSEKKLVLPIPFNDLHAQYLTIKPEIDAAISEVITTSNFIRGPFVEKFEEQFGCRGYSDVALNYRAPYF